VIEDGPGRGTARRPIEWLATQSEMPMPRCSAYRSRRLALCPAR
jgi:hypothetical protein